MKKVFNFRLLLVLVAFVVVSFSFGSCSDISDDEDNTPSKKIVTIDEALNNTRNAYLNLYDVTNSGIKSASIDSDSTSNTLVTKIALRNGKAYIPSYDEKRVGYEFYGWVESSETASRVAAGESDSYRALIGNLYSAGDTFTQKDSESNSSLYALWRPVTLSVNGEPLGDIDTFRYDSGVYEFTGELTETLFKSLIQKSIDAKGLVSLDFSKVTGDDFSVADPVLNERTNKTLTLSGTDRAHGTINDKLLSVVLPGNLKTLARLAFYNCSALKSVATGGVKVIKDGAFMGASSLETLTLENVTTLNGAPFVKSGLKTLELGATVESVTSGVEVGLTYCSSLTSIKVSSGNKKFSSDGVALFSDNGEILLAFPPAKTGSYTIPSGTKALAAYAFSQSALDSVDGLDGVAFGNAFYGFKGAAQ